MWVALALVILLVAALAVSLFQVTSLKMKVDSTIAENEQLQLTNDQLQLANEYEAINSQFARYEDQAMQMGGDTILAKYNAAKTKIEQLLEELNSEKKKSQKRISQLQNEISTLRGLLRHYVAQVDSLGRENAGLRAENEEIRNQNQQLNSRVREVSKANEDLSERMTLAEKLNVTGLSITPLKKNGKKEKNVTKAYQLMVTFTIPQNNSTPVGNKTIYLRITSPEGSLLGNAGTFSFEGSSIPCTAKKTIEYSGEEIPGVTIYWDVNTALTPGDYTVELFADNYRLTSRHFTLKK
jgi:regulator of replication initiation timing